METRSHRASLEWVGAADEKPPEIESSKCGWPILHAANPCDGINPMTGRLCSRVYHVGYHRDLSGAQWLDD